MAFFDSLFFSSKKERGGVKKEGGDLKRDLIGALLLRRVELARRRRPLPKNTDGRRTDDGRTTPKTAFFVFGVSFERRAATRDSRAFKIVCFFPREIEIPFKNLPKKELNPVPGKNQTSPLCRRHRIER